MRKRAGSVVTIGAYDGVHLGHRKVIEEVCRRADTEGLESIVVTFDRHPASVVRPESAPLQLTDLPLKLELLHATGIDDVELIEFTPERASESAEDFVEEVLVGELETQVVVVGSDFHFGRERGGNVALLEDMGSTRGFVVVPFDLVSDAAGGPVVSSTRIRALVAAGELDSAAELLGRPHEVRGLVVGEAGAYRGAGEGSFGVSVEIPAQILLPPAGGYSAEVGMVGAAGVPLEHCRVVVGVPTDQSRSTPVAVLGLRAPFAAGVPVRILFPSPGPS